jgi:hypothetical protein
MAHIHFLLLEKELVSILSTPSKTYFMSAYWEMDLLVLFKSYVWLSEQSRLSKLIKSVN